MHFEPEMWEQRIDNKRKLKQKAVPTIFQYYQKKKIFCINQEPDVIEEEYRPVREEDQIIINDKRRIILPNRKYDSLFFNTIISLKTSGNG